MTSIPKQSRIPLLSFFPTLAAKVKATFLTFDGDDLEVDVDALDDPERGTLDGAIVTNYYKVKYRGKSFGRGRSVFLILPSFPDSKSGAIHHFEGHKFSFGSLDRGSHLPSKVTKKVPSLSASSPPSLR